MSEARYDPQEIEPRWQRVWADEKTWEVPNGDADSGAEGQSSYVLEMLPYPSGEPHIGHLKVYSVGDAVAHFQRRNGRRVLHPMGYDAFGLPAENHAIKTGQHPRDSTEEAIAEFQRQFHRWGISIDWSRELATCDPSYYRWTQWIFNQLLGAGLAYQRDAVVKWCPQDQTVLANEQVVDGRCERCGAEVEARQLNQWFLRITDYADRLLDDLDSIDWPEHVKTMQRNWIGRSEGAEVVFRCEEMGIDYPVFTTRPDTLFGATFFVMAPEHPDVERLAEGTGNETEVREYVNRALTEQGGLRGAADREKTGVFLGRHVTDKGVQHVLPALAVARETIPDLRAVILGDGPLRDAVRRQAERLGLDDAVDLPGFVAEAELDRALRHALCLVLPSRREGFGLAVLDAASRGVPSVVVRGPDNAALEMIEPGVNGAIALSTAPGDLADAILAIHRAGFPLRTRTAGWWAANAARLSAEDGLRRAIHAYAGDPDAAPDRGFLPVTHGDR